MTQNQLQYWRDRETARSNAENERIANRSQRWKEFVDLRTLAEQRRTHIANEGIAERNQIANSQHLQRADAETSRHNLESERLTAESTNLARDQLILGYQNLAQSAENARTAAAASRYAADRSAYVGLANVAEASRSNAAREAETSRSNRANEVINAFRSSVSAADQQTRADTLNFEKSKWTDSVVTAQRKANLVQTQANTKNTIEGMLDRRVSTVTRSMRDLASIFSPLGGYTYK